MEDSAIIQLYYDRNEDAITESNKKYGPYCQTIAWNILTNRESAEECVNDTWLQSWNAMPPQLPNCLRAFFGRITRNLSVDRYRAANRIKRGGQEMTLALEELGDCLADSADVEAQYELRELGKCINRFLQELPKRDRDLFLCRYYYIYPIAEIARKQGLKENHIRSILSRTRQKLKIFLEKEGYYI